MKILLLVTDGRGGSDFFQSLLDEHSQIINFFPMKCELLVWKNTFAHKKWKHVLSIPFFYVKRILYINKFMVKNKNLPYSIGTI